MAVRDPFQGAARDAARNLRRLPKEARRVMGAEVKDKVADPLGAAIATKYAGAGPMAAPLASAVKTRVNVEPVIVVGGAKRVGVSGGARARDLVWGVEFGSGTHEQRAARAARRGGRTGSRQKDTTVQFAGAGKDVVFGTFREEAPRTWERWLGVLEPVLDAWNEGE